MSLKFQFLLHVSSYNFLGQSETLTKCGFYLNVKRSPSVFKEGFCLAVFSHKLNDLLITVFVQVFATCPLFFTQNSKNVNKILTITDL